MTPAQRYIARLYEQAVDRGLDVPAIRSYLTGHGLSRCLHQIEHELEHTYGFVGYVARHPTQPVPCVRAYDKAIDRGQT